MKIHKEGNTTIIIVLILLMIINIPFYLFLPDLWLIPVFVTFLSAIFIFFILWFFRKPHRVNNSADHEIICPADGKVVVIEEVFEGEFLNEKRIQISVFMSPLNVHINWYPLNGEVIYSKYHPGKHLVAWHPKSSTENERSTVVVKNQQNKTILMRQIAGAVARRIVTYAKEDSQAKKNTEMGFIKFGSRVDIFLPLDAEIKVRLNQKVSGNLTILAALK